MEKRIGLNKNLRFYREKQGLTQRQLAEIIGYTEKSVSKWENDGGMPTLEVVAQLAKVFGISLDELVFRKTEERYCLGIDGGGTKTAFKLADENGKVLRSICKGASNPNDIGIDNTTRLLDEGIREICRDLPCGSIAMYAGISGGGLTGNHAKALHRHFEKYGFLSFDNGSDIENLAALTHCDPCVLFIMGTGMILFALSGGARHRIAGWGQYFDDGGSGYTLGRDAVSAALCAGDGSGEKTVLRDMMTARLGETPEAHVSAFYREGKRHIAAMADLVFDAAAQGDAVAQQILDRNMAYAARMIDTALRYVDASQPVPVFFSGGVSTRHDVLFPLIRSHLQSENCRLIRLEQEPVDGALLLARQLLQSAQNE